MSLLNWLKQKRAELKELREGNFSQLVEQPVAHRIKQAVDAGEELNPAKLAKSMILDRAFDFACRKFGITEQDVVKVINWQVRSSEWKTRCSNL